MRGYVEALEAYEQDLPAGVEVDYDKFDKWFRGDSKQQKSLGEPRQIRPERV